MPIYLQVALGITTLISMGVSGFVAYNSWKTRALFSEFKIEILGVIATELKVYVRKEQFDSYVESHAREHIVLDKELESLRKFKHDTNSLLREHDVKIEDSRVDVAKIEGSMEEQRRDKAK